MAVGASRQICFHAGRELFIERSERAVNALAHATTTNARAVRLPPIAACPRLNQDCALRCTRARHPGGARAALLSAHRATAQLERLGEQSDGLLQGLDEAIGAQRRSVFRPPVPLYRALKYPSIRPRVPQHYP